MVAERGARGDDLNEPVPGPTEPLAAAAADPPAAPPPGEPLPLPPAVRRAVGARYLALLRSSDSALLDNAALVPQLLAQVDSVLDAVAPHLQWRPPRRRAAGALGVSARIGTARAQAGISPAVSLSAAALIFEAALDAVAARLQELGVADAVNRAAVVLNRAILERMAAAGVSYVETLLAAQQTSGRLEREKISRELHDVAAPTVALALQSIELHGIYAPHDPAAATAKLDTAVERLHAVLQQIRELASQLRERAGELGLAEALQRWIDVGGERDRVTLAVADEQALNRLTPTYTEEVFLIVREAVRNAITHAGCSTITVDLAVSDDVLRATVSDDGRGFDPHDGDRHAGREHGGVGTASMRERAALMSGEVRINSSAGVGTTVVLRLPLPARVDDVTDDVSDDVTDDAQGQVW